MKIRLEFCGKYGRNRKQYKEDDMEFEEISRVGKWELQWNGLNQGKRQFHWIGLNWTKY